ncbi:MAG: hypothetical protein SWX82_22075 [Cyanobacteriota bacterium]|nr:hypothetical protein [Cyanobacteriota bacterium]
MFHLQPLPNIYRAPLLPYSPTPLLPYSPTPLLPYSPSNYTDATGFDIRGGLSPTPTKRLSISKP